MHRPSLSETISKGAIERSLSCFSQALQRHRTSTDEWANSGVHRFAQSIQPLLSSLTLVKQTMQVTVRSVPGDIPRLLCTGTSGRFHHAYDHVHVHVSRAMRMPAKELLTTGARYNVDACRDHTNPPYAPLAPRRQ